MILVKGQSVTREGTSRILSAPIKWEQEDIKGTVILSWGFSGGTQCLKVRPVFSTVTCSFLACHVAPGLILGPLLSGHINKRGAFFFFIPPEFLPRL